MLTATTNGLVEGCAELAQNNKINTPDFGNSIVFALRLIFMKKQPKRFEILIHVCHSRHVMDQSAARPTAAATNTTMSADMSTLLKVSFL